MYVQAKYFSHISKHLSQEFEWGKDSMHFDISRSDFIWTNVKIPDTLPRSTFIFSCFFVMALNPLSEEIF